MDDPSGQKQPELNLS